MKSVLCGISLGLLAVSPAMAQGMAGMHDMAAMDGKNGSLHAMPGTVTRADSKTGLLDVTSHGYALKLHFPPASLAGIKPGDKVTLQLGFTRP